jgi:hypothetical protein
MKRIAGLGCVTAGLLTIAAAGAAAQETPVARLLPEMVSLAATVARGESGDHRQHFIQGLVDIPGIYDLNRAIMFQAAGFSFGPSSLVVTRREGSPDQRLVGLGYIGTGLSLGSTPFLFNFSYQSTTFSDFDDLELRDGQVVLYVPHAAATGEESDRDLLQQFVQIRLNRKTALFSVSRGWGSRFDTGVVLPVVQVNHDVRILTHVLRTASSPAPGIHEFNTLDAGSDVSARYCQAQADEPTDRLECRGSSSARGIGDIVVWGKAMLFQGAGAMAVTLDVRLPSGDADELIGLGATQVKPGIVWSFEGGRIGARARAEYTWSNGSLSSQLAEGAPGIDLDVPDTFAGGFGIDANYIPRTTIAVDVFAQQVSNLGGFSQGTVAFPSRGPGPLPSAPFVAEDGLVATGVRDVIQTAVTLGLRFDLGAGVVGQVNTYMPVGSDGLRPQPMAVFGLTKRY